MSETSGINNEESLQNLSENQQESQQDSNTVTNLNKEIIKQSDTEMEKLKKPKKQPSIQQFFNQPTVKRIREGEDQIQNGPSKIQKSASRVKRKIDNVFITLESAKKTLQFSENESDKRVVVFSGKSSETSEQLTGQKEISSAPTSSRNKDEITSQKSKPPPIHITSGSGTEIKRLTNEINNQPNSFLIHTKKDKFRTKIVTSENWTDYRRFIKLLEDKKHSFHTYSEREPQLKYVLYGLPAMEIDDLEKELQTENITPNRIVKMSMKQKKHENDDDQNYLLYFKKIQGENFLQSLNKVKCVYGFKVRWANYKTKHIGPTQCSKCLQFGHGQRGCYKPLNCFRCSEQHDSRTCPYISKENNKVPLERLKCFFCGEKHTALSPDCNIRTQIIEKWKAKSTNGNNRDQNKTRGEHYQNASGQRRFNPQTPREPERSNRSVPFTPRQQLKNNAPMPTTSKTQLLVHQNPAQTNPKPQSKNPLTNNKPSNQGKTNQNNQKKSKRNKNKGHQNKRKEKEQNRPVRNNSKQNQNLNKDVEEMDTEVITPPSQTTNEVIPEPSTSRNEVKKVSTNEVPVRDTTKENKNSCPEIEKEFKDFIGKMLNFIKQHPECLNKIQEAIGSVAKNTTCNHEL